MSVPRLRGGERNEDVFERGRDGLEPRGLEALPPQVVTQHIASGKLRMIGITGSSRSALFPDYPTIAETGLPNYQSLGWFGLFAPAKTPREIVAKVSADTAKVLALPDAKQRLTAAGAEPAPNAPDVFAAFVNKDIAKWLDLAQKAGIKLSP